MNPALKLALEALTVSTVTHALDDNDDAVVHVYTATRIVGGTKAQAVARIDNATVNDTALAHLAQHIASILNAGLDAATAAAQQPEAA